MYSSSEITDRIDETLGEYRALERRLSSALTGSALTVDTWRVLRFVQRNTAVTMKDVLDATGLPPASATRAVDALVTLGYGFRRSAENDRRSVQVLTTAEGTQALIEIEASIIASFAGSPGSSSPFH